MNYPRLFVNGTFSRIIKPIQVSINENIVPLSTASITMPYDERLPSRSYVELFTPYGSAGMYRVRSPHNAYGGGETNTAELEHMISEVGDYLVKEKLSDMMNATTAFKKVFSHYKGGKWKLGDVSALGSTSIAIEAEYTRVLDSLLSILEQKPDCMMAFDFTTSPWTLKVVKRGTTVTAEGRLARNVTKATITYDDSELVTRAWYRTFTKKNGTVTEKWVYKDASTKSKYGLIEKTVSTSSDMTSAEITNVVDTYINEHKEPKVNVSIQATELAKITGESMDKFTIGKMFRLNMPDYSVTLEDVITSITWNDPYNNPNDVTVVLGKEQDTVVTYLHNLDTKGKGGGGGSGKAKANEDNKWKEYFTKIEQDDYQIALTATRVDKASNILEQAGMQLNSKGVLLYATDKNNKNLLTSKITVAADKVSQEVKDAKKGLEAKINIQSDRITEEVSRAKDKETQLEGKLIVEADKASMTVSMKDNRHILYFPNRLRFPATGSTTYLYMDVSTGKYYEWKNGQYKTTTPGQTIKAGEICVAINESNETIATIEAEKIHLLGETIANKITASYIGSKIASIATLSVQAISATGSIHASSVEANNLYLLSADQQGHQVNTSVKNAIKELKITQSGNTYTLQKKSFSDAEWQDVNSFSRATTLSDAWSNGTLTVTASPQNETLTLTLAAGSKENADGTAYTSGNTWYVPIDVTWGSSGQYSESTGWRVYVDATSRYRAGKASVTLNDPTWNAISGNVGSSRTISVTTSGRTNASGTTENLTKSTALYLTASGLTVSLRQGSTSGTVVAKQTCSDSDLVAGNIKDGVTIFGVTGTYDNSGSYNFSYSSMSTGSSEPSGSFGKSYSASKGYTWLWFTVTVDGHSQRVKIKLLS